MSNFENSNSPASQNNNIGHPPIVNRAMENLGGPSVRRPRGRPLGSKNKPKGNPSPTQTSNKVVIRVPDGYNIIQWVEGFALHYRVSFAILTGSGSISKVVLKQKGSQLPSQEFKGRHLDLVSFSGVYVLSPSGEGSSTNFFNASLRLGDGRVVSGSALHMVADGPVLLSAFILRDPEFCSMTALA